MSLLQQSKRIHPLVAVAAGAVTLFSLVGIAAITGVLPSSHGSVPDAGAGSMQASALTAPAPEEITTAKPAAKTLLPKATHHTGTGNGTVASEDTAQHNQAPAAPALSQTPSAAVPAAAAPPAPPVPTAPKAFTSLDQAAAGLEHNPQAALDYLEQAVAADPANERAAALRIVALYRLARYGPCSKAIRDAREAGHPLWPMALRNPPLREMLEQDAKQPRLTRRKPTPPPDSEQTSQP